MRQFVNIIGKRTSGLELIGGINSVASIHAESWLGKDNGTKMTFILKLS